MKPFLVATLLALLANSAAAESIFKCTNPDTGAVEFTDEPCSKTLQTEQIEVAPGTIISSKQVYRDLERLEAQKAGERQAKEQAKSQEQQPDEAYGNHHPAAGALNKIKALVDTLRAPFQ